MSKGQSALERKKNLTKEIMELLNRNNGRLSREKTLAEFSLNTGFKTATIKEIILSMEVLGYLVTTGDYIFTPVEYDKFMGLG
jgi:hypothetical protein